MVRITSEAFHEKLTAGKDEIILNGPPGDLRGHIFIRNKNSDALKVKSLPMMHGNKLSGIAGRGNALRLSCKLHPGEEKMIEVHHQLHPLTAPGTYESSIMVGGEKRKVKVIVQQQIEIDVQPSSFTFTGTEPGQTHIVEFTLTNIGNVPFQIPNVKHAAALDMDMLCRAWGVAMRNSGDGYEKALDEVAKNVQSNLPDWAKTDIAESGTILDPGEKILIHLRITLPDNCNHKIDYNGNLRFWNKDIEYVFKSHNTKKK